ncbi:hypothetical protein AB0F43_24395 [Kribbella sp. NPDC023972]|uniref:GNAT family N-acetyltransferase n=1 Tax=Kribbella sp. NPDC023972 TaxID=3154795 RepID=UPI0033E82FAE
MSITWKTRAETSADIEPIRELTRRAFGRQFEVDFLDALRADPVAWIDGLSFVATVNDEPVAHALLTPAMSARRPSCLSGRSRCCRRTSVKARAVRP